MPKTKEVQKTEKSLITYDSKDGQKIKLSFEIVKKYLVRGKSEFVTEQEAMFFMGICKSRGLNPFAGDCYLIKYSKDDPASIVTSIDFFRSRATIQKNCIGWQCGIIVKTKSGEIKKTNGLLLDNEILVGGWFSAKPNGWEAPFVLEINLSGFIKTKSNGELTRFWRKENQPYMIMKVAESQGLRRLWPNEFGNMYEQSEINNNVDQENQIIQEIEENANQELIDIKPERTPENEKDLNEQATGLTNAYFGEKQESKVDIPSTFIKEDVPQQEELPLPKQNKAPF